ncbi:alpha/beta hydrolase [Dokdonia sp. Hel_I_53]|uniref:alpha/beta hydrolase n=1 Tax=Dokdonia sp. Hel_I_53 TaxID=1566287 RepID=UPI00119BD808|nr:esterase [Dokdonia sp. Hel_I_53]TVZ51752.1 putative esterase [Dokdonia sp. Hel_I_53]
MTENQVSYIHTNTYNTLNTLTAKTKNVWLTLHGMGYLSKYFIKYFEHLDPITNYIVAPQAPSKYYQDKKFKYIGASWLTKENRALEIENVFNYLDQVWKKESSKWSNREVKIILMGYSQGVSLITRWIASRKISCHTLLLHSGAIPEELSKDDFNFLSPLTTVTYLYGNKDEYITEAIKTEQQLLGSNLFEGRLGVKMFEGKHEVNTQFLKQISDNTF